MSLHFHWWQNKINSVTLFFTLYTLSLKKNWSAPFHLLRVTFFFLVSHWLLGTSIQSKVTDTYQSCFCNMHCDVQFIFLHKLYWYLSSLHSPWNRLSQLCFPVLSILCTLQVMNSRPLYVCLEEPHFASHLPRHLIYSLPLPRDHADSKVLLWGFL